MTFLYYFKRNDQKKKKKRTFDIGCIVTPQQKWAIVTKSSGEN